MRKTKEKLIEENYKLSNDVKHFETLKNIWSERCLTAEKKQSELETVIQEIKLDREMLEKSKRKLEFELRETERKLLSVTLSLNQKLFNEIRELKDKR